MFDHRGYLSPGFHDWILGHAEKQLVKAFPKSRTRGSIWAGYLQLCDDLLTIINGCEHWLDGSFTTSKLDPGDLDLLVVADESSLDRLSVAAPG